MYMFHQCKSGMCVQYENKNSVTAYLSCAYLTGFRDDNTGTMLAHLSEHIACSMLREIMANSSETKDFLHFLNAYTNWNTTVFWLRPINTSSCILSIVRNFAQFSEAITNDLILDEEQFERERISVDNETLHKTKESLQQEIFSSIYGLKPEVVELTDTLVINFIKNYYKRIVITIVGSLSTAEWNNVIELLEQISLPKCNETKILSKNKIITGNLRNGYVFKAVQLFESFSLREALYLQMLTTLHMQIAKKSNCDKKLYYCQMNGHELLYRITYAPQKCREYQIDLSESFCEQYFQSFIYALCLELDNPENIAMWHLRNQYSFGHSFSIKNIIGEYGNFDYNYCINLESNYSFVFKG